MFIILQSRLQQYVNWELTAVQAGFSTDIKLPASFRSWKKLKNPRKTSISALLTTLRPLTVDHNKLENSLRYGNTRPPYLPPKKPVCNS